jgi:hypothetical protein
MLSRFPFFSLLEPLMEYLQVCWLLSPATMSQFLTYIVRASSPLPLPGQLLKISPIQQFHQSIPDSNPPPWQSVSQQLVGTAIHPCIASAVTLTQLLSSDNLILLFSAALCEQRIVMVSEDLARLSNCLHGLAALLFPFEWPHIFIPILPKEMLHYTSAPMPFIVGLHSSHLDDLLKLPLDSLVVVFIDKDEIVAAQGVLS